MSGDGLAVIWHDLECGAYDADLPLWRALAGRAGGPVLDVGAGTGRVALDLARRGHEVLALDAEEELLAALRARAAGLPVETVCADARDFALGRRFPLIIVPMQTAQILGGPGGRAALLRCAAAHLRPGGRLALAIADTLEAIGGDPDAEPEEWERLPLPDIREIDGTVYASRPVAVVEEGPLVRIDRVREVVAADGTRREEPDVVRLDRLTADELEAQGRAAGLRVLDRRAIAPTEEYIGSAVVMLGG